MKAARALLLLAMSIGAVLALAQKKDLVETPDDGAKARPLYAHSHALIIGINRYPNLPSTLQLSFATKDAIALKDELVKDYGFPAGNVQMLLDETATLDGIRAALAALTDNKRIQKDDRILIYFSGHGQTVPTNSGGEMGYLIPSDAKVELDNPTNSAPYLATCLPMKQVWDYLDNSPAKHALVIADACFGGQMVRSRGLLNKEAISAMLSKQAREIISAGDKNQETIERSDLGHGVFTAKLLDQLRSRAADKGVVFTVHDLFSSLQASVATATGGRQTPMIGSFESDGEFLFVPGGIYVPEAVTPPAKLAATLKIVPSETSAKVYVDGKLLGTGASETTIEIGENGPKHVTVRVEADGFTPKERDVALSAGQSLQLDLDLTRVVQPATPDSKTTSSNPPPNHGSAPVIRSAPLFLYAGMSSAADELGLSQDQRDGCVAVTRDAISELGDPKNLLSMPPDKVQEWNRRVLDIIGVSKRPRLQEIAIQVMGNRALSLEEVRHELSLTTDQISRLDDLQKKADEANRSLLDKVRNGEIERTESIEAIKKNREIFDKEVAKILTSEQAARLKELGGAPMKKSAGGAEGTALTPRP